MIKKALSFIMMFSIVLISFNSLEANASEDYDSRYVKVGLERAIPKKSTISLMGKSFIVGRTNENTVNELFKIDRQSLVAKIKNFSYHIELSGSFSSYDAALAKAKSLSLKGLNSYVAYKDGFKVYIGEFNGENQAKQFMESNAILKAENTHLAQNLPLISVEDINNEKIISFDKDQGIFFKSTEDLTTVEGNRYRGYIGFINNASTLTTLNCVKIGEYLKGVVPGEMPASWEMEALKAQSVSARNYALRNLGKHKSVGYDLCDSQNCQMYYGHSKEHINTNQAIDETRNKLLKYNGEIAETFYSSCSGGYTTSNEDAWNGKAIPYLRGKRDPYSDNTAQSNWTYTISKAEAANKLNAKGYGVGQITSLETIRDSLGGRVLELKVTGTNGTKVVPKENVRAVFGYSNVKSTNYRIDGSIDTPGTPLPEPEKPTLPEIKPQPETIETYVLSENSTSPKKVNIASANVLTADGIKKIDSKNQNIVLSNGVQTVVKESNKGKGHLSLMVRNISNTNRNIGNTIVFRGSGYGHGVGMSQYGSRNMAKEGHDFRQILEFYFTGARVE